MRSGDFKETYGELVALTDSRPVWLWSLLLVAALAATPGLAQSVPSFAGMWLVDGDHRSQKATARPFILGAEIGGSDPPHRCERRADVVHRLPSPGGWL